MNPRVEKSINRDPQLRYRTASDLAARPIVRIAVEAYSAYRWLPRFLKWSRARSLETDPGARLARPRNTNPGCPVHRRRRMRRVLAASGMAFRCA